MDAGEMEPYSIVGESGRRYRIRVAEVEGPSHELVQTLVDIDLQTFSESTFSQYTAAAFITSGRVFLLYAEQVIIGTCVCMRSWADADGVLVLSMGIRPGWRGRGLGLRFVQGVKDSLAARGVRTMSLLVATSNQRALKVYEELGFVTSGLGLSDPRTGDELVSLCCSLVDETP